MSKNVSGRINKFNGHQFKKSLGQNFISDINLLTAIGEDSGVSKDDFVVEVGAGAGTLTNIIAKRCKEIVSFEVDKSLTEALSKVQEQNPNLRVVFRDIMDVDLDNISREFSLEENENFSYKVVANLPYYITTPIIFKFLKDFKRLKSLTIMVQKEVGERIVATPKNKEYGALSAMVNFYGNARICRIVRKQNFYPMPKVDSCIVRIDIENGKFSEVSSLSYEKLIRVAFNNRRKTLVHNLTSELKIPRDQAIEALIKIGLNEKVRGEELSTSQYVELIKILSI